MTTENRKNHKASSTIIPIFLVVMMCACNLPVLLGPTSNSNSTQPAPSTSTQPASSTATKSDNSPDCLNGIQPGKTTKSEVISLMGEPAGTDDSTGVEVMLYDSPFKGQYNSIALQNETVVMLSEILGENDSQKWSAIQEEYGEPAHTTYSNYLQEAMTYIYPDNGLAFVADQAMDVVFIKQCFIPMSIDDYLKTWGAALPTENPFIQ